jgi:imidazolonepropionase-like amidohydrolase
VNTQTLALVLAAAGLLCGSATYAESVVLQDVRVIDGNGGPVLEHTDILISGQKIVAVTPHGTGRLPPDTRTINLAGKTVVPGLISDHAHLGIVDGATASGHNITHANIRRQLKQYEAYGVTTVTSLGLNRQPFYDLRPGAHRGKVPGADMFGADRGFGVTNGLPPVANGVLDSQIYRPGTPEEARADVRESARRHPDLLKIWVDDLHGTMPDKMSPDISKAIIDEAHINGLRVAAHIYYLEDAARLVNAGIDVLAHGVRDKPVDAAFIQSMKERGAWYIPTLSLDEATYIFAERPEWMQEPFFRHALQPALARQFDDPSWRAKVLADTQGVATAKQALATNLKNVKSLYDAGVQIGFGTDSGASPLRIAGFSEHRELKLLTDAGLTPVQAIGTATKSAAALLHLEDRGVIAPGKLADLIVVEGDPAKNITDIDRIDAVWHRGKQVAASVTAFASR